MMFGAGLELRAMSMSELVPMPERARRLEVFTGAGRRRTWPADEKAAIVAESYAPGRTVCGVARRHGLTPTQLFTWRRLARRSRLLIRLLSGFRVVAGPSGDEARDEGAEESFAPAAHVMYELEEAEIERQLLLRD